MLRGGAGIGLLLALLLWLGLIDLALLNDAFTVVGTTPVVLGGYCAWLHCAGGRVTAWRAGT